MSESVNGGVEHVWLWTKAILWPVAAVLTAPPLVLSCGGIVRTRYGLGYRSQLRDVLEAAWKYGIFPTEYYHHHIFEDGIRADKSVYLNEREILSLVAECNRGLDSNRIDDLRLFYSECQNAGFAVPRTIATFRHSEVEAGSREGASLLPEKDLFIRPDRWSHGEGGELWRWNSRARIWSYRREALGSLALIERCRKLSTHRNILIQEALNNHPDMARFSSGGFCTVRIATGMDCEGLPVPMFASLCLPAANQGGWAAPTGMLSATIDIQSGSLNPALGEFLSDGVFHSHPETGAIISGATVPQWSAILDLALRAHRHFSRVPFVGWEIGFSGAGPVILEASTNCRVNRCGMPANTPFAQLCHERLALENPDGDRDHFVSTSIEEEATPPID